MARDSRRPCASAALCSSDIGIVTTPLLGPEGRLASLYIVKCANSQNRGYKRVSRRYPKSRRSPGDSLRHRDQWRFPRNSGPTGLAEEELLRRYRRGIKDRPGASSKEKCGSTSQTGSTLWALEDLNLWPLPRQGSALPLS